MKYRAHAAILFAIIAQSLVAQTLQITLVNVNGTVVSGTAVNSSPVFYGNFPDGAQTGTSNGDTVIIKVDSAPGTAPGVPFIAYPAPGTSKAGNWLNIAYVSSATSNCSAPHGYVSSGQIPLKDFLTTPAFFCLKDVDDVREGYYSAFVNFKVAGKIAARLRAELRVFPTGYLQLTSTVGKTDLEGQAFKFNVPGVVPPAQSLLATVQDNGVNGPQGNQHNGTKIAFSRFDSESNPVDWITVQGLDSNGAAVQNAVSPATFRISIDPLKVPQGVTDLGGYVQFDSSTDALNHAYIGESFIFVSATVTPPPPALSITDNSVVQLAFPNGPLQQTVALGTNGPSVPFTASALSGDGTGWLQVSPTSGTAPTTLTLTANVNASRAPNTYPAVVTVTPKDPSIPAAAIRSQLTVTKPVPTLSFTPASINLTCGAGGRAQDQSIAVSASDGSRVDFNYRLDPIPGVSVDGSAASTNSTLTVHGNCQNLAAGVNRGNLTFAEVPYNPAAPTQSVAVTLTVTAALTLSVNSPSLQFNYVQGDGLPPAQTLNLFLSNGAATPASLKATTQSGEIWLFVPVTGTTGQPISILVNPTLLQPGSYTGQIAISAPNASNQVQVTVQLSVASTKGPVISGVTNSATGLPEIAPGAFFSVYGSNPGVSATNWDSFILNGSLPTELQSVQVKINNQNAAVSFVNDRQINAIVPAITGSGTVQVQVLTKDGLTSTSVVLKTYSPAIFHFDLNNRVYGIAVIFGENQTTLAAPAGASLGYRSRPARPGDVLLLYATGLGPTNPPYPDGKLFPGQAYAIPDLSKLKIQIGGVPVNPQYAGLVAPGLFQINLTLPGNVADGDQSITLEIGSEKSPATTFLAVQH